MAVKNHYSTDGKPENASTHSEHSEDL